MIIRKGKGKGGEEIDKKKKEMKELEEKTLNFGPENFYLRSFFIKCMDPRIHAFFHKYFLKIYLFFLKILIN